ncbi:hypothetical protein GUJ93_ZPchr0001g32384 [Zizania palustris]|uniref:Uncharacterized protein n=1 Tax=Zizania palustris TaxID=103762 RepID=A0A8J5VMJ1_ZIZPA|nr:hypothetical protein GUJ93_ZPchr0001g32384 [Zizania palustris]
MALGPASFIQPVDTAVKLDSTNDFIVVRRTSSVVTEVVGDLHQLVHRRVFVVQRLLLLLLLQMCSCASSLSQIPILRPPPLRRTVCVCVSEPPPPSPSRGSRSVAE